MAVHSFEDAKRSLGRSALLVGAGILAGAMTLAMLGCAGPSPTPTSAPAPTKPAATTAATSPAAATKPAGGQTAGDLANNGKTAYASSCAGCHGAQGQGGTAPALIGSNNQLKKYGTGKGLYDKVSTTMPRSSPGSLSSDQYLQVVAFLLVQDNFVQASAPLSPSNLDSIKLQ